MESYQIRRLDQVGEREVGGIRVLVVRKMVEWGLALCPVRDGDLASLREVYGVPSNFYVALDGNGRVVGCCGLQVDMESRVGRVRRFCMALGKAGGRPFGEEMGKNLFLKVMSQVGRLGLNRVVMEVPLVEELEVMSFLEDFGFEPVRCLGDPGSEFRDGTFGMEWVVRDTSGVKHVPSLGLFPS